jgi:hypothetical protein
MQLYYQAPKDPADRTVIGFDYTDFLGDDTIGGSSWSVVPDSGLTISEATATATSAFITVSGGDAGVTYRLTNSINTADGLQETRVAVLPVSADELTDAYLGVSEAAARLWGNYGIGSELNAGDLRAASSELDSMGPWIGRKFDYNQLLSFPRSINLDNTTNDLGVVPEDILDAVALLAYHSSEDIGPGVTSESVLDRSITYSGTKAPQSLERVVNLVWPYQRRVGTRRSGRFPLYREPGDYLVDPRYLT